MLRKEDNELLTRVGPGTPMGALLRHYWMPTLMSEELPEPGCPPVRTTLFGEKLVVFRDHNDNIGAIEEFCAHRGASLFLGRNESEDSPDGQCGLRCVYHGWKYSYDGRCIDQPNEPPAKQFKENIKLTAYPAREHGGVIWIYMGPKEAMPPLPEYEWTLVPDTHRFISKRRHFSNFMQAVDGTLDSSHVTFLHADAPLWHPSWTHQMKGARKHVLAPPEINVRSTDFGLLVGARRDGDNNMDYWRITNWIMPSNVTVPRDDDEPIGAHIFVPIDDETTWAWNISYVPERPLSQRERSFYASGGHIHAELIPGTFDPVRNKDNDYLINRDLQRTVAFTGITGIVMQDAAVQESMGPIADRSREHLGSADTALVAARRRLLSEARALRDTGALPTGRDPQSHHLRSISTMLPKNADWLTETISLRAVDVASYRRAAE
ncbi:MAG: Rieske 2Fe-2S domain-containing protein [Beijerinckiaceae bacterium]